MNLLTRLSIFLIFLALGLFASGMVSAASDEANINLQVITECNSNGVCESSLGETETNCFNDCGCNNNDQCQTERGENTQNCPNDCRLSVGGGVGLYIQNLFVDKITFNSAEISWQTSSIALCLFLWGFTDDHEKEIISETSYIRSHLVKLTGLQLSATYHFKIKCTDYSGLKAETGDRSFSTLTIINNVRDLKAVAGDKKITLSWTNPAFLNFAGVRAVRNDNFYPTSPEDGIIRYEGPGNSFTDGNLVNGKRYYYTIFVYDKWRNYSSGAIISAVPQPEGAPPVKPPFIPPEIPVKPLPAVTIEAKDFNFYSDGSLTVSRSGEEIRAQTDKILAVFINRDKVPADFKTIILNWQEKEDVFGYLFELDKEKTTYSTMFNLPKKSGVYPVEIVFLDNNNNIIKKIIISLAVYKEESSALKDFLFLRIFGIAILFLAILFFLWLVILKRKNLIFKI